MDITLALGGGGSRGHAHVGIIRRLEQEGFRIRAVAGSSAGGIIAAFYAAGFTPDEMEVQFSKVDQTKLFGRSPGDGPALLGVAGASKWLNEQLGERTFADLKTPCALTAVDIKSAREIVLDQGRLVDAVLRRLPYRVSCRLNRSRIINWWTAAFWTRCRFPLPVPWHRACPWSPLS